MYRPLLCVQTLQTWPPWSAQSSGEAEPQTYLWHIVKREGGQRGGGAQSIPRPPNSQAGSLCLTKLHSEGDSSLVMKVGEKVYQKVSLPSCQLPKSGREGTGGF